MRAPPSIHAALAAIVAASCASGCSVVLDWDSLTNGESSSESAPQTVWTVPCHSVFVAADEPRAFVTRYATNPEAPGLYEVNLLSESPADAGALLKGDGLPAAGIAGAASDVVFATRASSGSVWSVAAAAPNAATKIAPGDEAFGVARTAEGNIYWAERQGVVHAVTAEGAPIDFWNIPGGPYYVAVNEEDGATIAYVAYNVGPEPQEGKVARLAVKKSAADLMLGSLDAVRGVAVRMLARPDKTVVPHVFLVTATGAKVAWQEANLSYTVADLGGDPGAAQMDPGEIVVDDTYAYWTMRGAAGKDGDVFRKAHHGEGPLERLGVKEQAPNGLALTEGALYWCSNQGLRRLTLRGP